MREHKSTHPWMPPRCGAAVKRKCDAEGTPHYQTACQECSDVIASEYANYVSRLKRKIENVPRNSKQWWRLNRCLFHRRAKTSAIPPLRNESGTWVLQPQLKANLFAETFRSQATLPAAAMKAVIGEPSTVMGDFVFIRTSTLDETCVGQH